MTDTTAVTLTPAEKKALKAQAHALDPVVLIGDKGLTPNVVKEIDMNLNAHGLIKVRDLGGERCGASATTAMLDEYQKRAAKGEMASEKTAATLGTGGY